jgi:hypothetical protein
MIAPERDTESLEDSMYRKLLIALSVCAVAGGMFATAPTPADAAPAEAPVTPCAATAFRQHDMAGVYVSPVHQMRVEIFPCGGSFLQWGNAYGDHMSGYGGEERISGGGIFAYGIRPDPVLGRYLDNSAAIAFKPAEVGYIQVITVGMYGEDLRVYRLRKIS